MRAALTRLGGVAVLATISAATPATGRSEGPPAEGPPSVGDASAPLVDFLVKSAEGEAPPGRSPYSRVPLAACGVDAKPTCELAPVCDEPLSHCRPPEWSPARRAWLRRESPDEARARYRQIATVIARTSERLVECTQDGRPIDGCERIAWPASSRSLALSALTLALFESGLREDVQFGHPPLGRGQAGEVCLVQVLPDQAARVASWLTDEQRAQIRERPGWTERFAATLLGDSDLALERCFEVGMRLLADGRRACGSSGVPWTSAMFAMYGTSHTCSAGALVAERHKTLERFLMNARKLDATP